MKSTARTKLVLLGIASLLMIAFAWSAASGQMPFPGPPRPNLPGGRPFGPNMHPPGMPRIVNVWRCTGCGGEIGRGLMAPPDTCPHCGARIINGFGGGVPQPGMGNNPRLPLTPPGGNPSPTRPNNPPQFQPAAPPPDANDVQPVVNAPPPNPIGDNLPGANVGSGFGSDNSSSSSSGGARKGLIIVLVIGIIVVGVPVLVGGTFLMIYAMKGN